MKSIWSGTISFGMVVIPVRLGPAASDESEFPLHRVRRADGSRIRMKRYAEADGPEGPEVAFEDTVPGFETGSGTVVLVEDSDYALAFGEKDRAAKILTFVPGGSIPRAAHEATYLVEPGNKGAEHAYELLAAALRRTGREALVSIAVRKRQALALLSATKDGYLTLERLLWASALRQPDFAPPKTGITEAEVDLAENLITQMARPFDWPSAADTSAQALADVIQRKAETGQVVGIAGAPGTGAPADLAELLRASVEAAKPKPPARKRPSRAKAPAASAA